MIRVKERNVEMEAEIREERRCYSIGFENDVRGHKPRNTGIF